MDLPRRYIIQIRRDGARAVLTDRLCNVAFGLQEVAMRLRLFPVVVIAVCLLTPTYAWARASNEHGTLPRVLAIVPPVPLHSVRHLTPSEIFRGCGTHRRYDPVMQRCLGPADF